MASSFQVGNFHFKEHFPLAVVLVGVASLRLDSLLDVSPVAPVSFVIILFRCLTAITWSIPAFETTAHGTPHVGA